MIFLFFIILVTFSLSLFSLTKAYKKLTEEEENVSKYGDQLRDDMEKQLDDEKRDALNKFFKAILDENLQFFTVENN